ncbi:MAG: ATP-binding cassette domain-containing protein [Planctomycetes bacterium]|jgi:iron complex transport system ATP-binding protein|nr:ATP-binding cassette domain-containing protein [Planctomycetota bacterium]
MPQPSQADTAHDPAPGDDASATPAAPLRVEQLSFGYRPNQPVLEALDAELRTGRLTALIGPNATGKTTLLRLMLGQLAPDRGRVLLDGREAQAWPHDQRARRIGYVAQRPSVAFGFTVRQVVAMGRHAQRVNGPQEEVVERALTACDLHDAAAQPFNELSGGQQQRVAVARALAQSEIGRPGRDRVLLLDEPCASADPRHAHQLLSLLRDAARDGRAVLVVLHDLNLAARWADDVWLLDRGRLAAVGAWGDVLQSARLDPVYGMRFTALHAAGDERPVFHAALAPDDSMR